MKTQKHLESEGEDTKNIQNVKVKAQKHLESGSEATQHSESRGETTEIFRKWR